jgi:hypothetical protein
MPLFDTLSKQLFAPVSKWWATARMQKFVELQTYPACKLSDNQPNLRRGAALLGQMSADQ